METRAKRKLENVSFREICEREEAVKKRKIIRVKFTPPPARNILVMIITHDDIGPHFLGFLKSTQISALACVCKDIAQQLGGTNKLAYTRLFQQCFGFVPPPVHFPRLPAPVAEFRDDLRAYICQLNSFAHLFLQGSPKGIFCLEDLHNNLLEETKENKIHINMINLLDSLCSLDDATYSSESNFYVPKKHDKKPFVNYWKCAYDSIKPYLIESVLIPNHLERFGKWMTCPVMQNLSCIDLKFHPLLVLGIVFAACYRTISSTPGSRVILVCRNRREAIRFAKYASRVCFLTLQDWPLLDHLYRIGYICENNESIFRIHSKVTVEKHPRNPKRECRIVTYSNFTELLIVGACEQEDDGIGWLLHDNLAEPSLNRAPVRYVFLQRVDETLLFDKMNDFQEIEAMLSLIRKYQLNILYWSDLRSMNFRRSGRFPVSVFSAKDLDYQVKFVEKAMHCVRTSKELQDTYNFAAFLREWQKELSTIFFLN